MAEAPYTTSRAILEAMREAGVRYLFANLGSDHTGIVEAYAQARQDGCTAALPELVLCPHEFVALSAAQGYAQVSGEAQAVLVHVDCGTQNLGGAVHNAARGRVPVLILAGLSPMTGDGELPGSRNEFIHWIQDTADQRGIVRGYVKYENEIRTGHNARQIVHRALQIARSEPAGPVYLTAVREVMEQTLPPQPALPHWWSPVAPSALAPQVADEIAAALESAAAPLVVTSYLGRDPGAVASLVRLCELAAVPVIESVPMWMNFPADHRLHWGYQWNTTGQNPLLAEADVVLVVGSDVPWIPTTNRPAPAARIYVLDIDPIKEHMPLWHVPATRYAQADLATALDQVSARLAGRGALDQPAIRARARRAATVHDEQRARWADRERPAGDGSITPEYLVACVREAIGPDALVLTEAITNYHVVCENLRPSRPGSLLGSGGSSLGWSGGAAVGAKLAAPGRTVVSLVGDGSYLFGVPGHGPVDGAPVRCPVPHRHLRQPGLGRARPVRARCPPGRGRGGCRCRNRVHPGGRPGGRGRRGWRRLRGHCLPGRQAASHPEPGARPCPPRQVRRDQRPRPIGRAPADRTPPPGPGQPRAQGGTPMARLDNKVALITGGESGIGLATARLFAAEGARVHLAGLSPDLLAAAAAELGPDVADWSATDVTDEEQVVAAVAQVAARFGGLDVLFSNAGISGAIAPITEYPTDVFRRVLDVHVLGAFHLLKHALPHLRDGGSVIINSSVVGLTSEAGISGYATAKHAQVGLMRTAAKEAAARGIRVNSIHPGPTDTEFQRDIEVTATGAPPDVAARIFEARIPLARHARTDEIARSVLYLACADSSFVTGATLSVDGGMHI